MSEEEVLPPSRGARVGHRSGDRCCLPQAGPVWQSYASGLVRYFAKKEARRGKPLPRAGCAAQSLEVFVAVLMVVLQPR